MIRSMARQKCRKPGPVYDADDLAAIGIVAAANAIIATRSKPPRELAPVLLYRARHAMSDQNLRGQRPYSVSSRMVAAMLKAARGQGGRQRVSAAAVVRMAAHRAPLHSADERGTCRRGRSGLGVLAKREHEPDAAPPELQRVRDAIRTAVDSFQGRERRAAEMLAERSAMRSDADGPAAIGVRVGLSPKTVEAIQTRLFAKARRLLEPKQTPPPKAQISAAAGRYGGPQALAAVLIGAGLIAGDHCGLSAVWVSRQTGLSLRECRGLQAAILREAAKAGAA